MLRAWPKPPSSDVRASASSSPSGGSRCTTSIDTLLSEPALPASQLAPRPLPRELDALLAAALAKDPDARPPDARTFADALGTVAA